MKRGLGSDKQGSPSKGSTTNKLRQMQVLNWQESLTEKRRTLLLESIDSQQDVVMEESNELMSMVIKREIR